jgi:hypothetical protein
MAHTGVALVMRGYSSALRRAGKRTFAITSLRKK